MADIFTASGVKITTHVRELQREFHDLVKQKAAVVAELAKPRADYKKLRATRPSHHPDFAACTDAILRGNEALTIIDNKMGALTRAVEAAHVLAKDGINARPGVATMGKPE